jgi:serine/threonine protein kinase
MELEVTIKLSKVDSPQRPYVGPITAVPRFDDDEKLKALLDSLQLKSDRKAQVLGVGGEGVVFLCEQRGSSTLPYALKVSEEDLGAEAKFMQEVYNAGAYVPQMDQFGVQDGLHYILMEVIPGLNLEHVLKSEGPLTTQKAAAIGVDIAHSIAACHKANIVYGDLKPRNAIVNGRTYLVDFGAGEYHQLVRACENDEDSTIASINTVLRDPKGTLVRLSPWQLLGEKNPRTDLFALGVLLYEMVAGLTVTPFDPDGVLCVPSENQRGRFDAYKTRVLRGEYKPITELVGVTGEHIQRYSTIVDKLLTTDEGGCASTAEVKDDLLALK